jgi:putative tryptophan/tyrosine transport system substrate-binding protein
MKTGIRRKATGNSMRARAIGSALCAMLVVLWASADAQQPSPLPRLGILRAGAPPDSTLQSFLRAMRELGYVEGKNIYIEIRYAEGNQKRSAELARELVKLNPDALFTSGTRAILDLKAATKTIPIVFVSTSDPIGTGMVESLARPGGNLTGMSLLASDLWPKRLELLTEIVPKFTRAAMLWNKSNAGMALEAKATLELAGTLGVALQDRGMKDPSELEMVLGAISKDRPDGLLALMDLSLSAHRRRILEFLAIHRVPAIFESQAWVEAGGLVSYGPSSVDVIRRAASKLDKILTGARPADLPVEQPMKFEFIVNLHTAKQIGLVIPPNVLARADRVIR